MMHVLYLVIFGLGCITLGVLVAGVGLLVVVATAISRDWGTWEQMEDDERRRARWEHE